MDIPGDTYLKKALKHWAGQHNPPDNGRHRLIWAAANLSENRKSDVMAAFTGRSRNYLSSQSADWSQQLFAWSVLYPFKAAW